MPSAHSYYVYLMASRSRVLYAGITNDLQQRVQAHKAGAGSRFTRRYNVNRLVWYRRYTEVTEAIAMEKRIKGWRRSKKVALVEQHNPHWRDLSRSR